MPDVIDPETGETRPSRLALRGQRPSPADVAAARRCRLVHAETRGNEYSTASTEYVIPADLTGRPTEIGATQAVRADARWLNPGASFLTFHGGLSLDHCTRLRPPDERGERCDIDPYVWRVGGLGRGTVTSGIDGVRAEFGAGRVAFYAAELADAIACLAAAQDDQRCRFGVGDPELSS